MKGYFFTKMKGLYQDLKATERLDIYLSGEVSDFCRFNKSKVRQVGNVKQAFAQLHLMSGKKHSFVTVGLSSSNDLDDVALASALSTLRSLNRVIPEDPYLSLEEPFGNIDVVEPNNLTEPSDVIDSICSESSNLDLVGIYTSGSIFRAYSSSLGVEHWFETTNFNFDWSLYLRGDKAVKLGYAGSSWDQQVFLDKLTGAKAQLKILEKPDHSISPGKYRAYLAPAAVNEVMSLLSWNGFSERALRNKSSCFHKMKHEGLTLSSQISFTEKFKGSSSPLFDQTGAVRPDQVSLIAQGAHVQGLVSARTAKEFGLKPTGVDCEEGIMAIEMNSGNLDAAHILKELNTGLYISNLWYLNYSDLNNCRITGMTRFASFWVENGEIVAPTGVMRFDDSCYDFFGKNLCGLTSTQELFLSNSSYTERSTDSSLVPGAVVDDFQLTL